MSKKKKTTEGEYVYEKGVYYCPITETYHDVEQMLHHSAWRMHSKYGNIYGSVEDYFGIACLAFMYAYNNFDPKKACEFTTHLHHKVQWAFRTIMSRHHDTSYNGDAYSLANVSLSAVNDNSGDDKMVEPVAPSIQRTVENLISEFTEDAQTLARLFVDTPKNLQRLMGECETKEQQRSIVRDYLMGAGWSKSRVNKCFAEIEQKIT